jgi:hypothetical protein
MSYPVGDIGSKIERAEKHVVDCRAALQRFIRSNPYVITRQQEMKSGKVVYLVDKADPVPSSVRAIACDVFQNLRTALDYIAFALVRANSRKPTRETSFPILEGDPDSDIYKPTFDGKVEGMGDEAIKKIKLLKPYNGGDDILWRLHKLNIIDKHRLLIAAGGSFSRIDFKPFQKKLPLLPEALTKMLSQTLVPIHGAFPLHEGQEILVDPVGTEAYEDLQMFIEIAIHEPKVIPEPIPLVALVQTTWRHVERVARDFLPYLGYRRT